MDLEMKAGPDDVPGYQSGKIEKNAGAMILR